jgi:DnaK suppressor protein
MSQKLTAAERSTLAKQLEERRRVLRSELAAKLEAQDNPRSSACAIAWRRRTTGPSPTSRPRSTSRKSRATPASCAKSSGAPRIKDGTYGECVDCGNNIPYARLHANPSASRCIACQEELEASQKRGPPTL